jgi:hypothetical protein
MRDSPGKRIPYFVLLVILVVGACFSYYTARGKRNGATGAPVIPVIGAPTVAELSLSPSSAASQVAVMPEGSDGASLIASMGVHLRSSGGCVPGTFTMLPDLQDVTKIAIFCWWDPDNSSAVLPLLLAEASLRDEQLGIMLSPDIKNPGTIIAEVRAGPRDEDLGQEKIPNVNYGTLKTFIEGLGIPSDMPIILVRKKERAIEKTKGPQ